MGTAIACWTASQGNTLNSEERHDVHAKPDECMLNVANGSGVVTRQIKNIFDTFVFGFVSISISM